MIPEVATKSNNRCLWLWNLRQKFEGKWTEAKSLWQKFGAVEIRPNFAGGELNDRF